MKIIFDIDDFKEFLKEIYLETFRNDDVTIGLHLDYKSKELRYFKRVHNPWTDIMEANWNYNPKKNIKFEILNG